MLCLLVVLIMYWLCALRVHPMLFCVVISFNILSKNNCIQDALSIHGVKNIVKYPTCYKDSDPTLLDLLITNVHKRIVNVFSIHHDMSVLSLPGDQNQAHQQLLNITSSDVIVQLLSDSDKNVIQKPYLLYSYIRRRRTTISRRLAVTVSRAVTNGRLSKLNGYTFYWSFFATPNNDNAMGFVHCQRIRMSRITNDYMNKKPPITVRNF